MAELKQCPWCGEKDNLSYSKNAKSIFCGNCLASGPASFEYNKKKAIAAWNKRSK